MQAGGGIQFSHQRQYPEYEDLIHRILTGLRDPNWSCSFRLVYSPRNTLATYLSILGGEFFCRLYIFFEPIDRMGELMDLDMGLGSQTPQFLETPMVQEELDVFVEIMEDGAVVLADAFMENLVLQPLSAQQDESQMQDVVFEEKILGTQKENEDDLFDLF